MPKKIAILDDAGIFEALEIELNMMGYGVARLTSHEDFNLLLDHEPLDLVLMEIGTQAAQTEAAVKQFKRIKAQRPHIIRVALSTLSDSYQVFKTIEGNIARLFLYRTWDIDALVKSIEQLFNLEDQLKEPRLLSFINSVEALPAVPALYQEVSQMVAQDVEVDRIAAAIERDPAIVSSILRVANSAFYGAKTGSISQAIMFIGLGNVKNIILSYSTFVTLSDANQGDLFWKHAVATNRLTHFLYEYFHKRKLPLVNSSAGLLHNVGQLLMLSHFKGRYIDFLEQMKLNDLKDPIQAEIESFNIDHASLGAFLLNWWDLPLNLVEVAMYHHSPKAENIKAKDVVLIVNIASKCAWYHLLDRYLPALPEEGFLMQLGLSQQRLIEMMGDVGDLT